MDMTKEDIKAEIKDLLQNYKIPMEDRELVIEKIDQILNSTLAEQNEVFYSELGKVKTNIDAQREAIRRELEDLKKSTHVSAESIEARMEEAYAQGLNEGLSMNPPQSPSMLPVFIGLGLLALAMVMVANKIFSRG